MLDSECMLKHILGLSDLMLFWTDDVAVIRVSRCGITRGTLSSQHMLTLIWMIGDSFKIVSNWAVLTSFLQYSGPICFHQLFFSPYHTKRNLII